MSTAAEGEGAAAANSYRLFLSIEPEDDVVERVIEQLGAWLRSQKEWEPVLSGSGFQTDRGRELLTLHRQSSEGQEFRARLSEPSPQGEWRTQLTVDVPRSGLPWLALRVTNSEGRWVAVPRLASYLMDSLFTMDGNTLVSSTLRMVDPAGVEELMESICDPDRQGLIFVAGSRHSEVSVQLFRAQVERWTRQVRGLAQVAVLTPEATQALKEGLGADHAVAPWTLRTFFPDVDPAIEGDGLRHRFLTRQRLVDERDEVIRELLGRIARRHSATRTPPAGYLRVDRSLSRLEDRLLVEAISAPVDERLPEVDPHHALPAAAARQPEVAPVGTVSEGAEGYLALVELVKATLGITEITEETLGLVAEQVSNAHTVTESIDRVTRQLQDRQEKIADLQDSVAYYKELYEEEQLDERLADAQATKLADENRWLKNRLAELGDFDGAYQVIPETAYTRPPTDFADLRVRLDELVAGGVSFTGDPEDMLALDEHDTLRKLVSVAWDALLVLADYVRARASGVCTTGVKQYLVQTPQGYRSLPQKKFAERETAATMQSWGGLREFPVPVEVAASGRAVMEAHFKLGRVGMVSPRMYYLDDWVNTQRAYVGYIGAHLRNTRTN